MANITQTGKQNYRDLQKQNAEPFNPETATAEDWYRQMRTRGINSYNDQPTEYVGLQAAQAGFGDSQYDEGLTSVSQLDDLQDIRYQNQPWYSVLANGIGKMLGTAATTFVSAVAGIPYGIGAAINEGRWSALWDNEVTQALSDVDNWLENNMTNYKSRSQEAAPWYSAENLLSMNFWADNVIKNAGFTLGAAASMAVGSGTLGLLGRAFNTVDKISKGTRIGKNIVSSLLSATGEGMIEAKQGVEERNKAELQNLENSLAPERQALEEEFRIINDEYAANRGKALVRDAEGNAIDPAYETYKQQMADLTAKRDAINEKYEAGKQQIEESGRLMGNKILLANQGLLTVGNLIQFSKMMDKSFDNARHAAKIASKKKNPLGVGARRVSDDIKDGYEITGKGRGKFIAATKGFLTEGSEEMNQQWIQSSSGAAYNEKDVNDYWRAKLDPDSYRETTKGLYDMGNVLSQGFQESWGDFNQWEQFFVGALTGTTGMYSPTKFFNQDKTKSKWNPFRYGSWEGGLVNELKDFNSRGTDERQGFKEYEKNIDEVNRILASEDFPSRVSSMIAHTYTQGEKEKAAEDDDKKAWKDADDKQAIHDIQAFLRAGKLDDLRAIYQQAGQNLTDEDIESIVKNTTKEISKEEDEQVYKDAIDNQIAAKRKKIDNLNAHIQDIENNPSSETNSFIEKTRSQIAKEEQEIANLEQQKADYVGTKHFTGPYIDEKGNRTKTNDEIRESILHNGTELNRKLDSYLESVNYVDQLTGGSLTKDQEDNLAYLHNMYKEKTVRFDKIMSDVRKNLPNRFLYKTNETPEQLSEKWFSSDLAFTRNEKTPKGYVEVDTSAMNDKTFGVFFAENIIWGQNINPSLTQEEIAEELKAQEEDKKYSEEEQKKRKEERAKKMEESLKKKEEQSKKDRQEQQDKNLSLIKQFFVDNALNRDGTSLKEALDDNHLQALLGDINDALMLRNEAAQFYDTFSEYKNNPQKVDQAKEKEEKKTAEDKKNKAADRANLDDMLKMSDLDLGDILSDSKKGKNKSGNRARKALAIKNGKSKLRKELDKAVKAGTLDEETMEDALKLFDEQIGRMIGEDDDSLNSMDKLVSKMFDTETEVMSDPEILLSDRDRAAINNGTADIDMAAYDERVSKAKDAINSVADPISKQIKEIEDNIDSGRLAEALDDDRPSRKRDEAAAKAHADEAVADSPSPKTRPKRGRDEEPAPLKSVNNPMQTVKPKTEVETPRMTSEGEVEALADDKEKGEKGDNIPYTEMIPTNWHPWRSATSEISYYGNEPYQPSPYDSNGERKKRRYDAVKKKLEETGAYTARKQGKIKPDMKVGFKVFKDVNDEADDFVIFVTDKDGNVLGDLPSNDPSLETSKTTVPMDALYQKIQEEWADATAEEKAAGFKSSYTSQIDHVLVGKVRYQDSPQTVSQLVEGSEVKPLFAIKVGNGAMHTPNVEGVNLPLSGNVGQPYTLIQTPYLLNGEKVFNYYAVPIHTLTVEEATADEKNPTLFRKTLEEILKRIKTGTISDSAAHHALESLIAVGSVHVNFNDTENGDANNSRKPGIRVTSFNRLHGKELGVPVSIFEGNREDMDIEGIMRKLGRYRVNVSATYINGYKGKDAEEKGMKYPFIIDGKEVDYNAMIAEVAETNAAEPFTVNNWFTVRPLEKTLAGTLKMSETIDIKPKWGVTTASKRIEVTPKLNNKEGVIWTVDCENGFIVYDEKGVAIEKKSAHTKAEKNEAKLLAAEAFGAYHLRNTSLPFACVVDKITYIYEPDKRKLRKYDALEKAPKYNYKMLKEIEERTRQNGGKLSEADKYHVISAYLAQQYIEDYNAFMEEKAAHEESKKEKAQDNNEGKAEEDKKVQPAAVDHTKEVDAVIKSMHDEASNYVLVKWDEDTKTYIENPEGDYYKDKRDNSLHARVSNVNEADVDIIEANKKAGFTGNNPAFVPAVGAGNAVDKFVRRFYDSAVGMFDGVDLNTKEGMERAREIAEEVNDIIGVPNIGNKEAVDLAISLAQIKQNMGNDWEIDSTGIVAQGLVSFDNENIVNVAGTIDLLAYNRKEGKYAIIDMKTHLRDLFDKKGNVKTDDKTMATVAHWRAQQTLYKNFLESKYGIQISGLRIMPFGVNYSTKFSETDYSNEGGILTDKGIVVDVQPKYDGRMIMLTPKSDMKYSMSHIPASVRQLLELSSPHVSKPEEKEVPIKGKLLNTVNKVPEGRSLKEFITEKYADNPDVLKLVDIIESNTDSSTPVLMTKASQSLVLDAIDQNKLNIAVQEKAAEKQDVALDIPENTEDPQMTMEDLDSDAMGVFEELPEELQDKIRNNPTMIKSLSDSVAAGLSAEQIEEVISADNAIRHKKAVDLPYEKLDLQREMRWLTKNLPQLSKERKVQIVKGLIMCSDGTADFGRLENDVISIGTNAGKGTVYHEAFHAVVQFFMTDEEIDKLFKAAKERYGEMPEVALEERLADDFEDYVKGIDYEDSRIRRFFKELWNAIKAFLGKKSYIETLFRNINTGIYSGTEFKNDRNNAFSIIASEDRQAAKNYEYLTRGERERLQEAGIERDIYNQLSKKEKEYMLHCVV